MKRFRAFLVIALMVSMMTVTAFADSSDGSSLGFGVMGLGGIGGPAAIVLHHRPVRRKTHATDYVDENSIDVTVKMN